MNNKKYYYVFERDFKGTFRVVKITPEEAKQTDLKKFNSEAEAWAALSKNPPSSDYQ